MTNPAVVHPLQTFLGWCDRLGIASQAARQSVLTAAVRAQSHDAVLFFLCGRDYIKNPTDLKFQGIEKIFMGAGAPFEINVGGAALDTFRQIVHAPTLNVRTEMGMPHTIGAFTKGRGFRPGGAGNYNLCTKALVEAQQGLGSTFLRDMVKGVENAKSGESAVTPERVYGNMREMRNATRRFWIYDMPEIGL
jgi:hypothetical protein